MNSPIMILDEEKRQLSASQFERKMQKSENKKNEQLYACRESYYIFLMCKMISVFSLLGVMVWFFPATFVIMPIYRSDSCHSMFMLNGKESEVYKW